MGERGSIGVARMTIEQRAAELEACSHKFLAYELAMAEATLRRIAYSEEPWVARSEYRGDSAELIEIALDALPIQLKPDQETPSP